MNILLEVVAGTAALVAGFVAWGKQHRAAMQPSRPSQVRSLWRFAVIVAAVLLGLILIPAGAILLAILGSDWSLATYQAQHMNSFVAADTNASPVAEQPASFDRMIERVLIDVNETGTNKAIRFRTGAVASPPAEVGVVITEWMLTNRMDLVVSRRSNHGAQRHIRRALSIGGP